MEKQQRVVELDKIKTDERTIVKSGVTIRYAGTFKTFSTHKIPLDCLVYNKHNGRIGSAIKSYEKQFKELNPEIEEDKKIIVDFLFNSKKDRNEKTMQSLINDHQVTYGVVTRDGIIVDGNRRAMLLNKIHNEREKYQAEGQNVDHCNYFEAIILPDEFGAKEIVKLETIMQMGQDEKLDYNPIEKYLKCKDLTDYGYNHSDIAEMMAEKTSDIEHYLSVLETMEGYLKYWHYDSIYPRLEKREDQFITLNKQIIAYKKNKISADWPYEEYDVNDLKMVGYDYIRSLYEGKDFRKIFTIFKNKEAWKKFIERHTLLMKDSNEDTVEEIRKNNPNEDLAKQLKMRDEVFIEKTYDKFQNDIGYCFSISESIKEKEMPYELLTKSLDALKKVNVDSEGFSESVIQDLLIQINKLSFELKKYFE